MKRKAMVLLVTACALMGLFGLGIAGAQAQGQPAPAGASLRLPPPTNTPMPPLQGQCTRQATVVQGIADHYQGDGHHPPGRGTMCLPTVGASVLEWWGQHGYPNFIYSAERWNLVLALDWYDFGPHADSIADAFEQVANAPQYGNNYDFDVSVVGFDHGNDIWNTVVSQVQAWRPMVLWVQQENYWHGLSLIGYYTWNRPGCGENGFIVLDPVQANDGPEYRTLGQLQGELYLLEPGP